MLYAHFLTAYKWLTAIGLFVSSGWAWYRGRPYSRLLLTGAAVFACAVLMDRVFPLYEPILTGWFVELAGAALLFLISGIVWYDTVRVYYDTLRLQQQSMALQARQELAQFQLRARTEQVRLQQDYVRRTREQLHESRNQLALIRHYLDQGKLTQLHTYLETLLPQEGGQPPWEYTGHSLVDAILVLQFSRARRLDVYVELDLCPLPADLAISDDDLTSLLMNLLDNALDACERLPVADRWLWLRVHWQAGRLKLQCRNAAPPPDGQTTSKEDKQAHGFGLPLLRKIAASYGGEVEVEHEEESFSLVITLQGEEP